MQAKKELCDEERDPCQKGYMAQQEYDIPLTIEAARMNDLRLPTIKEAWFVKYDNEHDFFSDSDDSSAYKTLHLQNNTSEITIYQKSRKRKM